MTDFWRMVWQENVQVIAMLEQGERKNEQYWPDSGTQDYGPFRVTLAEEQEFSDYTLQWFQVEVHCYGE